MSGPSVAVMGDRRRAIGRAGEAAAERHLGALGFDVIERNYRTRAGELDLVAYDGRTLVFCEVKTRQAGGGTPWEALGERKRRQVRTMAAIWLSERRDRPRAAELRFDAIGVVLDGHGTMVGLDHLEAAF